MSEEMDDVQLDHVHNLSCFDSIIPPKVQRGFSVVDIEFTCLCATEHYIAIGTNVGIAYLYHRTKETVDRLRFEGSINPITCVVCLETVDLMVAVGTSVGLVMIFQVPIDRFPDLERNERTKRTMKRYLVTELHRKAVTCVAWSQNGMKLYSGDEEGTVSCTEMDYANQQSRSSFVLCDSDSIVQLQYHQRMLLISTVRRTLLCFVHNDESGYVPQQIGVKERKTSGPFGASFHCFRPQEPVIFVSRPALRLWKANAEGKVVETFIFKDDPPPSSCKIIGIRRDTNANVSSPKTDSQFGRVHCFGARHLLVWNDKRIYVICIDELRMVARCDDLGPIRSVSNCSDEIFAINGPRSVVRIASSLDRLCDAHVPMRHGDGTSNLLPSLWTVSNPLKELEVKWRDSHVTTSLLNKLKLTNLGLASSQSVVDPFPSKVTPSDVIFASEDQLRNVDNGQKDKSPILVTTDFGTISAPADEPKTWGVPSDDDDEDEEIGIVFERKSASRSRKRTPAVEHNFPSDEQHDLAIISESSEEKSFLASSSDTIADKERLLAKLLGLDALFSGHESRDSIDGEPLKAPSIAPDLLQDAEPLDFGRITEEELAIGRRNIAEELPPPPPVPLRTSSLDYEDIYKVHGAVTDDDCSLNSSNQDSYLSYGPPSGSSALPSFNDRAKSLIHGVSLPLDGAGVSNRLPHTHSLPIEINSEVEMAKQKTNSTFSDQWIQHSSPKCVQSLAVCDEYIVCTDAKNFVYYSSVNGMGLDWHRVDYMAKQVAVSSSGHRVWRIHKNSAFALVNPSVKAPFGSKWIEAVRNVNCLSVDDHCVWFVTLDGNILANCELESNQSCGKVVRVSCPWKVAQIACFENVVWVLTVNGKVACRVGVSSEHPTGFKWSLIEVGCNHVFAMALGTPSVGWIVDDTFTIWFKSGLNAKTSPKGMDKKWWRVKLCNYVFQSSSTLQTFTSALKESLHPDQLTSFLRGSGNLCIVASKSRGVWFYNPNDGRLYSSNSHVVGHHWHRIDLSKRFRSVEMTASGVYHQHGGVWLWDRGPNIYCFNPTSMNVHSIKLPESKSDNPLLCFCAAPEVLWILLESGCIYIRSGITLNHPLGSDWVSLDLAQIANHKLVHVSCGPDVVWACDSQGNVLMRIGTLQAPTANCLPPAWVSVIDDRPVAQNNPFFVKVYVGATSHIVWAIDGKRNVYVREGVFSDLLIGVGWVLVSGVQAISLAISEQAVYALTNSGSIFRRFNITQNNYIGDYWRELPGYASILSVSVNDHMWALDQDSRLLRHLSYVITTGSIKTETLQRPWNGLEEQTSVTEEEWEIVNAS